MRWIAGFVSAAAVLLVVVSAAPLVPTGGSARARSFEVRSSGSPPQIRTGAHGVVALAVDGSTVIYALDGGDAPREACAALRVWSITTRHAFAPTTPDCGSEFVGYGDVAVAGEKVVWSATYESNHVT